MNSKLDNTIRVLMLGDVVGRPGRTVVKELVPELKTKMKIDLVVVNGENAAGGVGIDSKCALELFKSEVDAITLGDHVWQRREFSKDLERLSDRCVRPLNYPAKAPGKGWVIVTLENGVKVGVVNLIGRTFINIALDCPFDAVDRCINENFNGVNIILCDMHAEATSEKNAMGHYLDGRVSVVFGTHTHVQTSDVRILAGGTGYITDLGMCGDTAGVIGMDKDTAIQRFLTGMPLAYKISKRGESKISGIIADINIESGKTTKIESIQLAK